MRHRQLFSFWRSRALPTAPALHMEKFPEKWDQRPYNTLQDRSWFELFKLWSNKHIVTNLDLVSCLCFNIKRSYQDTGCSVLLRSLLIICATWELVVVRFPWKQVGWGTWLHESLHLIGRFPTQTKKSIGIDISRLNELLYSSIGPGK